MYIRMKHKYSLIVRNNNIAIYDADKDNICYRMKLSDIRVIELLERLRMPLYLNDETEQDTTLIKGLLSKYLSDYFEEVDRDSYLNECIRNNKINRFHDLYKNGYDLNGQALMALVRKVLYMNRFVFIGFEQLPEYYGVYHYKIQTDEEVIEFNSNDIYIINIAKVSWTWMKKFEKLSLRSGAIRLYVRENNRYLQIGPTLNDHDFGCLFCDRRLENLYVETELFDELSPIGSALLEMELIKICRCMIEATIEDITISNGKFFVLDKYTMEAKQEDKIIDVNCKLCGGIDDEL